MGQLLSERMQQKNGKIFVKREVRVKQERTLAPAAIYSSNNVFENPIVSRRQTKLTKRVIKEELSENDSAYTSSPIKRNRYELLSTLFRPLSLKIS